MRNGDLARARWSMPLFAVALVFVATVAAAQTFPPLTGSIVDQADILSPAAKAAIEPKLAELEPGDTADGLTERADSAMLGVKAAHRARP
jgi:hypothetical protein